MLLEARFFGLRFYVGVRVTLRTLADADSRLDAARLDELLARASRQEDELEALRVRVVNRVFGEPGR
jgi:hypothetical protein